MVESNEDVPPESLNTLLADISLVSPAGRQAGRQALLWPNKMDATWGKLRMGGKKTKEKREKE